MGSSFNPQFLVEKLSKLNITQASIETLSHWCIFHMHKARQVVETWDRQFHCAPREQRLAYLYLANDILQNSRRKGSEFVGEFWKVLPDALRDLVNNGDEFARNAAMRLVGIWEDRKVFGSRGQILKEELVKKQSDNGRVVESKMKLPVGDTFKKLFDGYQAVYDRQVDEDVVLSKCRNAISSLDRVCKEPGSDVNSGQPHGSGRLEEVQRHNCVVRDSILQLKPREHSRSNLVLHLREALREEELKLEEVRKQLQVAHSLSQQADNLCRQLLNSDNPEQTSKESPLDKEQSSPTEEDSRKSAAAAVAAKLTASSSSAQMLSYVLSSLASEGVIGNSEPSEKRQKKFDNDQDQPYIPPSSSSPPPLGPLPYSVPPYVPGLANGVSYSYHMTEEPGFLPAEATVSSISSFSTTQTSSYEGFRGSEGFYGQQQPPSTPIFRE